MSTGDRRRSPSTPRRWPVVIGALLVVLTWLALGGLGGSYAGRLSEVQKNDNASFLPQDSESTAVLEGARAFVDEQQLPFLVAVEKKDGTLTPEDLKSIASYAASLTSLPLKNLEQGATLGDYLAGDAAITPIPSEDGQAALLTVLVDAPKAEKSVDGNSPMFAIAEALREAGNSTLTPTGLTAYVGGPGGLIADFVQAFAGIDGILLGVALLVVLIILLIVYRSPVLPLTVLLSSVLGLGLASLAVFPLAKAGHVELSGQSQGIMFILVVGAATDYALLLVSRFKEELHDHESSWVALRKAWRGAVEPILASGSTVILGLLCLMLASLGSTSGLGPIGALGIAGAMLASLTFLPAVLALFGRYVFWPFVPRVDHVHAEDRVTGPGVWGRIARLVDRHPRRTWAMALAGLVAAAAFVPTFRAEGVSTADTFLTKVDSVESGRVLAKHFPAGSGSPVQVLVPEAQAEPVLERLQGEPGVDAAWAAPAPGAPPLVKDGRVLLQATLSEAADSPRAADTIKKLRADLRTVSDEVLVGGDTAINLDVREASWHDLKLIVPIVLFVIFLVLCLLLRSILAPALLMAANVLSFAAALGVAALLFNHVFGFPGADPAIPLYSFVFLVALGIDYSIFLMTRVREETITRGTRKGVLVGLAVTGGVITSAGVVLAATFSALAVLPLIFLVQMAFIVAFGVLVDTLIVRSLLVPALVRDIGPRVWWPSRLEREADPPLADVRGSAPSGP